MVCPRCGDVCHCSPDVRATAARAPFRTRFEPDGEESVQSSPTTLVDPEPYDSSEEQFSASLEATGVAKARFIPDQSENLSRAEAEPSEAPARMQADVEAEPNPPLDEPIAVAENSRHHKKNDFVSEESSSAKRAEDHFHSTPDRRNGNAEDTHPDAWKQELAARLNSYRARRKPRPPKYPSLSLNFETPPAPTATVRRSDAASALALEQHSRTEVENPQQPGPSRPVRIEEAGPPASVPSARIIEFPRFFDPEPPANQLAEPICDQPRILDAPEVELPAPALGGIVLEAPDEPEPDGRPGFEVPLHSAPIARRIVAAVLDFVVITAAGIVFAYIFLELTKTIPPVRQLLSSCILVLALFWAGYQYLLLTYSGTTPGLRLAQLRLAQFDGSPVLRSTRRWRVLASILSGVSLGLGFAWCFLDEDSLCWHDRITRTHVIDLD